MKRKCYLSIALFLFSVFVIGAEGTAVCLDPESGVVSWWTGDGHFFDITGPNNGTPLNGTKIDSGMVDQAFSFDGVDDWVLAPGANTSDLQQFTIEHWVKHNSLPSGQIQRYVNIHAATLRYDGVSGPGQLHFYLEINNQPHHIRKNNVLNVDFFYHIAGTYDGSVMRLYQNGTEIGNFAIDGTVATASDGDVVIGAAGDGAEAFDGLLDELSIYDRALSAAEIKAIYDAGSDGKCKPPRPAVLESTFDAGDEGWWIFGDGTNFTYHVSGGNPGGFISAEDQVLGESWWFVSPGTWAGDWNFYTGGIISFDLNLISGDTNNYSSTLDVLIDTEGTGHYASWSSEVNPELGSWTHYEVQLSESNFEITGDRTWDEIISNVTWLLIRGEHISGPDIEGIDNIFVVNACEGDVEPDGDADGIDIATLIDSGALGIDIFSEDFGRINCP